MVKLGLGIMDIVDERLVKRTWHGYNGRWFLDGMPVSERVRRDYLKTKRRATAKTRRQP
jgi:hypothetical protein